MCKLRYSIRHAQERALERFGLGIGEYDVFTMVRMIMEQHPDVEFIERQSSNRTIWKIRWEDTNLFTIYNRKHKVLATFLTKGMVKKKLITIRRTSYNEKK